MWSRREKKARTWHACYTEKTLITMKVADIGNNSALVELQCKKSTFSLLSAQKLMIAVSASRKPSLLSRQWLSCLNFLQVSAFLPRPPDPFPCCCRQTKINAVFRCYQSQRLRPWEPTDNPSSVRWPLDFYCKKNIHFLDLFSLRPSSSNTPSWADSLWWLKCVRA